MQEGFKSDAIGKLQVLIKQFTTLSMVPETKLVHLYWMYNQQPQPSEELRKQTLIENLGFQNEEDLVNYETPAEQQQQEEQQQEEQQEEQQQEEGKEPDEDETNA